MPGPPGPSNTGVSSASPSAAQSSELLDGLLRYMEEAKKKTGSVGEPITPCSREQPDIGTPMERLMRALIAKVYGSPDKKPRLWTCYDYASPEDKQKYLDRVQAFFQKNVGDAATQLAIATMLREEYQNTTYGKRQSLVDKSWPEPSDPSAKKRQEERANTERKGFERAMVDRLKDPSSRAQEFEASLREQSFPAIQYDLGSGGEGPVETPEGWVRAYVTVGDPHRNPEANFKDVWRDPTTGKITANPGGDAEHFWLSVGMPRRQVFYFYKYFMDGAPAPTIRSFLIPKSVFVKDIAAGAITEKEKKEREDALLATPGGKGKKVEYSALTVDSARSPNQFGVGPKATAKILETADPKSLVTIGLPKSQSKMDPFQDGTFYTIQEFEKAVGVPTEPLILPDGGTANYAEKKDTLKVRESASEEQELGRMLESMEAVQQALAGNPPAETLDKVAKDGDGDALSTWMLRLVEVNDLAPCAVMRSGVRGDTPVPHDAHGNPEDRAHEETLFAYFVLTHPEYWQDGLKAVNDALRDEDKVKAPLDVSRDPALKQYISKYDPNVGKNVVWQDLLQKAESRIGKNQDPDQAIHDASLMFYLYRPLVRKLSPAADLDVKVNTRQFSAGKAIPRATAQERKPFGLVPRDGAPDEVRVFDPDPHRSLDKFIPQAENTRKPEDKLARTQEELQMPFAGGISGTTRDQASRLVPRDADPARPGLRVSEEEYWQFQTANTAFMVAHGYHSFYESMGVAFEHPDFGKGKGPVGPSGDKDVYANTMGQVNGKLWQDYQAWKGEQLAGRGGKAPSAKA